MSDEIEVCEVREVHKDKVDSVCAKMPEEEELYDLAELFKVFGDSTRIRILLLFLRKIYVYATSQKHLV